MVYDFEPKTAPRRKGDLATRIGEDLKGKMWIAPDDAEILRVEFANVAPLTFGYGFLGNAKSFEGYVEHVLRGFALLSILPMNISVFFDDRRRVFQSDSLRRSDWREPLGMVVEPHAGGREVHDVP